MSSEHGPKRWGVCCLLLVAMCCVQVASGRRLQQSSKAPLSSNPAIRSSRAAILSLMKTALSEACNGRDVQAIAKAAAADIGLATAAAYSATMSSQGTQAHAKAVAAVTAQAITDAVVQYTANFDPVKPPSTTNMTSAVTLAITTASKPADSQGGPPSKAVAAAVGAALLADLVSALSDTDGGRAPFCLPKPRLAQPAAPVGLNTTALPVAASPPQLAAQFSGGQPPVPSASSNSSTPSPTASLSTGQPDAPSTEYLTPASPSASTATSPEFVKPALPAPTTQPASVMPAPPGDVVQPTQPKLQNSPAPSSPSAKSPTKTAAPTPPDTGSGANWNGFTLPQAFTFPPFPVFDFGPGGGGLPLTAWNPFDKGN